MLASRILVVLSPGLALLSTPVSSQALQRIPFFRHPHLFGTCRPFSRPDGLGKWDRVGTRVGSGTYWSSELMGTLGLPSPGHQLLWFVSLGPSQQPPPNVILLIPTLPLSPSLVIKAAQFHHCVITWVTSQACFSFIWKIGRKGFPSRLQNRCSLKPLGLWPGPPTSSAYTPTYCPRLPLRGRYLVALGHAYHPEEFVCSQCGKVLEEGGFFEEKGAIFCPPCYDVRYAPSCAKCKKKITGVSRAGRWVGG